MKNKLILLMVLVIATSCITRPHIKFNQHQFIEQNRKIENIRVALVLGGGGSRGVAHIGVLEVLEKHKIPIDLIVATSAGSIIGALYADSLSVPQIKEKIFQLNKWDILDLSIINTINLLYTTSGLIEGKRLEKFLSKNLTIANFEQASIPAVFVATDILQQKTFIFNKGPLIPAIMASSAIPPVIPPVEVYNKILIDGGVMEPVPVRIAKKYHPKIIIAVDICEPPPSQSLPKNTLDLTYWALWVSYNELAHLQGGIADIVIKPELEGFGMFNNDHTHELYNLGVKAAEKQIPAIKAKLKMIGS
ncbi:patatin-like phospholipase family protein [Rickettsiales endosymbiont of Stachyamoeba lipophora]|uniref:patatin-like phospholipase family protein n=1 Tax=Rickettsiales endosymbiont of Stachyamoeba lipophora TaxID=2486578 RepID=UPI000F6532CA|nr:patatin-like phospholipase family protein [Rickettsiales endosymbiont of Stachyamoeba lipophora]AZL16398.1 hypothetical protein EF513_07665 [Rickettsiales endosymbiont of Stachyamoeba lipophora]